MFDDDKRPLIIAMPMFPGTLVRGCSGCFEDYIPQPDTVMVRPGISFMIVTDATFLVKNCSVFNDMVDLRLFTFKTK